MNFFIIITVAVLLLNRVSCAYSILCRSNNKTELEEFTEETQHFFDEAHIIRKCGKIWEIKGLSAYKDCVYSLDISILYKQLIISEFKKGFHSSKQCFTSGVLSAASKYCSDIQNIGNDKASESCVKGGKEIDFDTKNFEEELFMEPKKETNDGSSEEIDYSVNSNSYYEDEKKPEPFSVEVPYEDDTISVPIPDEYDEKTIGEESDTNYFMIGIIVSAVFVVMIGLAIYFFAFRKGNNQKMQASQVGQVDQHQLYSQYPQYPQYYQYQQQYGQQYSQQQMAAMQHTSMQHSYMQNSQISSPQESRPSEKIQLDTHTTQEPLQSEKQITQQPHPSYQSRMHQHSHYQNYPQYQNYPTQYQQQNHQHYQNHINKQ